MMQLVSIAISNKKVQSRVIEKKNPLYTMEQKKPSSQIKKGFLVNLFLKNEEHIVLNILNIVFL